MITRHEWRWVAICTASLIVLLAVPVLWGWLAPPDGWQFYRGWFFSNDYTQYRSAMAQGYAGAWLIINRFTPESHTPVLQYPLYITLGHISRWLRLPLEIPYLVTSGIAVIALACTIYAYAATFFPDARNRKLAFLLMFSVGPTWLIAIIQAAIPMLTILDRYKDAVSRAEFNTFLMFFAPPHLPLALAILLFILMTAYRQWQKKTPFPAWRFILSYILSTLFLGLLNPFSLPTLLLPLGLLWIARSVQARRVMWQEARPLIAMGLTALPLVAYNFLAFTRDPFWGEAYGSQNHQPSFAPDVVLLGYGVVGLLALVGAVRMWRARHEVRVLVLWSAVVILIGYIPVNYQRRFSLGLAPALTLLAVWGWREIAQQRFIRVWQRRAFTRIIGGAALVLCLWGQNIMFYSAYVLSHLGTGTSPYAVFQPRVLAEAAAYLDAQGESVTVLTCEETGNLLAGEIRGRVVLGHAGATLDVNARREAVANFFADNLSPEAQTELLASHNVSHILAVALAPLECGPTYIPPDGWIRDFNREGISIYTQKP